MKTAKKSKLWMWVVGGVVGVSGAAATYLILSQKSDTVEKNPEKWDPPEPRLPPKP